MSTIMKKQVVRVIFVMLTLLVCGGCSKQEKNSNDKNTIGDLTEEEEMLDPELWASMDQYEKIEWKMRWAKCKPEDFSYHVTEENTVVIDAYTGTDDIIVIPEKIEGKPVEKVSQLEVNNMVEGLAVKCNIEKEAFAGWTELKVVQLYGEIKEVGDYAFRDCPQLRYVYMGDEITDLGKGAFYDCEKLCEIQLSKGITALKEDTFAGCKALLGVALLNVKEIEKGVFSGCVRIRFLLIPEQMEKIESFPEKAYMITNKGTYGEQYAKTQGIHVTNDYTEIYGVNHDNAQNTIDDLLEPERWIEMDQYEKIDWKMQWAKCKPEDFSYHVTEENTIVIDAYTGTDDIIMIPEEIEGKPVVKVGQLNANNTVEGLVVKCNIEKEAFAGWTELKVVQLYGEIKEVGDYAFRACPQLRYVYMGDEITDLGKGAFYGCEKLREIQLSKGITVLKEDTFAGCKALDVVGLPNGLKEIEKGVFSGCVCIHLLRIPDQVEKIESFPEKAYMITNEGTYGEQYAKEHGIHIRDDIIVFY